MYISSLLLPSQLNRLLSRSELRISVLVTVATFPMHNTGIRLSNCKLHPDNEFVTVIHNLQRIEFYLVIGKSMSIVISLFYLNTVTILLMSTWVATWQQLYIPFRWKLLNLRRDLVWKKSIFIRFRRLCQRSFYNVGQSSHLWIEVISSEPWKRR